jgi:hypothetical protein
VRHPDSLFQRRRGAMKETICEIFWEGPFPWQERQKLTDPRHVLYSIHGIHHIYGNDVLLYLGMTESTVAERLRQHAWINDEYDPVTVKVASIGTFESVDEWWKGWEKDTDEAPYDSPGIEIIRAAEALLIYAHQPSYNDRCKAAVYADDRLRIFNTGKCGRLLPEVSHAYFEE